MADTAGERSEPPAKKRRVFLQTMGQQLREVGLRESPGEIAPSFAGSSGDASHTHSAHDNYGMGIEKPQGRESQIRTPESDVVAGEDDQLVAGVGVAVSAASALWQPGEVLASADTDESAGFTFDDLVDWTRSYFDHWHPAYPFLHAPSTLEYFEHIVHYGISDNSIVSNHKLTILRSIISISLADRRQSGETMRSVPSQLVFPSLNNAIQSIQCLLTDESSITSLQALVSVQLLLLSMLRYNAASRLEGLAVRMAYQLGLQRCPQRVLTMPQIDAELRQRLFWSMYCIDRYICIRLGVPLGIRDIDIDVCFPTSERHRMGSRESPAGGGTLDLLGFLAKHAEIRGSITELRNRSVSYRQIETDEAIIINSLLTKWWNEVEEYLEPSSSGPCPISEYHRVTLIVLRHESVIALNKHTLATSKKNSAYDEALQNCISAARSIITTLYTSLKTHENVTFSGPHESASSSGLFWPSFTWAVWVSVFLMVYAVHENQISVETAIKFTDRGLEILKHLELRGSMWPHACAAGIRDLRAEIIDRQNRSMSQLQGKGDTRNESTHRAVQSPILRQSSTNIDFRSSNSSRLQNLTSTRIERPNPQSNSSHLHQRQESSTARVVENLQQHSQPSPLTTTSSTPQPPGPARHDWFFSEPLPNFEGQEGGSYMDRIGTQIGQDSEMPNYRGSELLYGLDNPFWATDNQWTGNSHNY